MPGRVSRRAAISSSVGRRELRLTRAVPGPGETSRLRARRRGAGRPRGTRLYGRGEALPFLAPVLAIYGVFALYPLLYVLYLSTVDWDGLSPVKRFVGLDNYREIFLEDPVFWRAFRNTLVWSALSIVMTVTLSLALALALNGPIRGRTFLRSVYYSPAVLSTIVVALTWAAIYSPAVGLLNAVLEGVGLEHLSRAWLGEPDVALYAVFVASVWHGAGVGMILFLAGLQGLPDDVLEAGRVDGATRLKEFRYVVLPLLRPTFAVVLALTLVNSLRSFDLIYGMTYGGPGNATHVLATWSYFQAFTYRQFGLGSAIAIVLLVLTALVVVPYLRWATREN